MLVCSLLLPVLPQHVPVPELLLEVSEWFFMSTLLFLAAVVFLLLLLEVHLFEQMCCSFSSPETIHLFHTGIGLRNVSYDLWKTLNSSNFRFHWC